MQKIIIKYGLICALISILLKVILYVTGLDVQGEIWIQISSGVALLVITIVIVLNAVKEVRTENGGSINFGQVFLTALITFAIYLFISSLYSYVHTKYINPDFADQMKIVQIERTQKFLEKRGVSEEELEKALQKLSEGDFSITPKRLLLGFAFQIFFHGIISLIIAAAIKKEIGQISYEQT